MIFSPGVPDVVGLGRRVVLDAGFRLRLVCDDHPDAHVVYEKT